MGAGISRERKVRLVRKSLDRVKRQLEAKGYTVRTVKGDANHWRTLMVTKPSGEEAMVFWKWIGPASNGETCATLCCPLWPEVLEGIV